MLRNRTACAAAAVFALSLALMPVGWAADEVWITLDRGSAQYAFAGLAAAGRPGALTIVDGARPEALSTAARDTDVVVGRISQRDVDLLPEILHAARRRCGGFVWHATRELAEKAAAQANDRDRRGQDIAPNYTIGEDDDASGVANLTEVIRVSMLSGYRPLRTVKFMAYAAEEVGLVGSAEIANAYHDQSPPVNVVGVLQLDMTNYKGSSGDIYLYTDYTNPTQNAFVASLVDTYLPGLVKGTSACGYGCSDHASWHSQGYPASFPFEALFGQHNPWIHTNGDTIAKSGGTANHALKFSKLAVAYLAEAAKGGFGAN